MVGSAPVSDTLDAEETDVSPSPELLTGDPSLPKDVWPDIVFHLSPESIENVMLVCHYFRTLAQPSFFRNLAIKPFNMDAFMRSSRNQEDINWIRQKLQFYSSPTIARHVEFCRISPHHLAETYLLPRRRDRGDRGRAIINALFELLPRLPNLTELDLDMVYLTDDDMKQISRIPRLNTILLRGCRITALTPTRLAVQTVLLNRCSGLIPHDPSIMLSSLLRPNAVECLCIMGDSVEATFFHIENMPPLHCLRTVCIHHSALTSFLPCLPHIPALRELILYTHDMSDHVYSGPASFSSHTIPLLERYEGPLHPARYFGQGRPVRHLKIWGANATDIVLSLLRTFDSGVDLESLEFYVFDVTESLLLGLFDRYLGFPRLKALEIKFDCMDHKVRLSYASPNYGLTSMY